MFCLQTTPHYVRGGGAGMSKPVCVGFSEIGAVPSGILQYHYPHVKNYGDATGIVCDALPDFDFLCAGFPCQSWSIAGKRQGFDDARGTLFFEIARSLSHKRPRPFLLENVKGLLSSDSGKSFAEILRILSELNYRVETVVINSKHFGVPQNRERVFFVGHLAGQCSGEILSFGESDTDLVGSGGQRHDTAHTITNADKARGSYDVASSSIGEDVSYAIDSNYHKGTADWGNTVTATPSIEMAVTDYQRIRRLTPVECARLQGFADDHAKCGRFQNKQGEWHVREISDTGQYQCYGNAVAVNVIAAIIRRMLEKGCLE